MRRRRTVNDDLISPQVRDGTEGERDEAYRGVSVTNYSKPDNKRSKDGVWEERGGPFSGFSRRKKKKMVICVQTQATRQMAAVSVNWGAAVPEWRDKVVRLIK